MEKCKIENCTNEVLNKNYCSKHYQQLWKYGKILNRTEKDKNEIIDCNDYYEIVLYSKSKKGEEPQEIARAIIDKNDLDKVKNLKWSLTSFKYVINTNNGSLYLHQLILGEKKWFIIDHINMDKLDNRKNNLRFCTVSQNGMNRDKDKNNTSGFKGVSWSKNDRKWRARINLKGKEIHLGNFDDKKEAARVYNEAAKKYHGEFARIGG